jgi:hypothetical protein
VKDAGATMSPLAMSGASATTSQWLFTALEQSTWELWLSHDVLRPATTSVAKVP